MERPRARDGVSLTFFHPFGTFGCSRAVQHEGKLAITRYGYDVVITVLIIAAVGTVLALVFIEPRLIRFTIFAVLLGVLAFTLNFFRDPERTTPSALCTTAAAGGPSGIVALGHPRVRMPQLRD